jgi:hypothetical protein
MNFKLLILAAAAAGALASSAQAGVVVDQSVDVLGLQPGFNAQNQAVAQNFLVQFTLGSAAVLTGADIYSEFPGTGEVSTGAPVLIRFRGDDGGQPGASDLLTFNSVISAIDTDGASSNPGIERMHADFAPTLFNAGTYWFGMSGDGQEIGWNLQFNNPNPQNAWQLSGDNLSFHMSSVAFGYRLDDGGAVPEPATWALMIGGFGLAGAALRRKALLAA